MWGRRRPHTPARAQGALPRARPADSPLQRLRRKESRRFYPLRSSSLIVATAHCGSVAYRSHGPLRPWDALACSRLDKRGRNVGASRPTPPAAS